MIDEYWTFRFYGYYSYELARRSCKPIVVRCDDCCKYRISSNHDCHDLCVSCVRMGKRNHNFGKTVNTETREKLSVANTGKSKPPVTDKARANMSKSGKGRVFTEEHKHKISESNKGKTITKEQRKKMSTSATDKIVTDKARRNMSEAGKGRIATDEARQNMSKAQRGRTVSDIHRRNISAGHQGIPYEEWTGFVSNGEYCEKFDDACRERIREKYDHRCFVCDRPQDENITKNGDERKLSVHHANRDKRQGCDGVKWKLVPLCMSCHSKSHTQIWIARINYLLEFVWE